MFHGLSRTMPARSWDRASNRLRSTLLQCQLRERAMYELLRHWRCSAAASLAVDRTFHNAKGTATQECTAIACS
jgi:hypothetical protein